LIVSFERSGRVEIDIDGYIRRRPGVRRGEVAATSATTNVTVKLPNYRRNGVQEYMIWVSWIVAIGLYAW